MKFLVLLRLVMMLEFVIFSESTVEAFTTRFLRQEINKKFDNEVLRLRPRAILTPRFNTNGECPKGSKFYKGTCRKKYAQNLDVVTNFT